MIKHTEGSRTVEVTCDRCGQKTTLDVDPDRLNQVMPILQSIGWAVPVEGLPDLCMDCKMRSPIMRA